MSEKVKPSMRLPGIVGNGAILQRNVWNVIPGTDESATEVTLCVGGQEYSAPVADGHFSINIPPQMAATGLTVTIRGSETIVLNNICFGDVYLLSGQSNMELPLERVKTFRR